MPNKYFRVSITKIRLSSHLFFIERGRWKNLSLYLGAPDFHFVVARGMAARLVLNNQFLEEDDH